MVTGSRGRHNYLVIVAQLHKRSRYYIFRDWAETPDGDASGAASTRVADDEPEEARGIRERGPLDDPPRVAVCLQKPFGVQTWLDLLSQMGVCPCEFVDCWNLNIN